MKKKYLMYMAIALSLLGILFYSVKACISIFVLTSYGLQDPYDLSLITTLYVSTIFDVLAIILCLILLLSSIYDVMYICNDTAEIKLKFDSTNIMLRLTGLIVFTIFEIPFGCASAINFSYNNNQPQLIMIIYIMTWIAASPLVIFISISLTAMILGLIACILTCGFSCCSIQ